MYKKLKAVIVGCGNIFPMHAVPVLNNSSVELAAICDVKPGALQKAKQWIDCNTYDNYEKMLKIEKPDVVHICTPHYLHSQMACTALNYGCHVLCEKPMATNIEDAQKMLNTASDANKTLCIIFQNRYNAGSQLVKKMLCDNTLGAVKSARLILTWDRSNEYYSKSDWKGTWDKEGGGVVIDQAIHTLDLMRWLIDKKVVNVKAAIANRTHPEIAVEDTAEGVIEFEGGVKGAFYAMNHYCTDEPVRLELFCENGKAVIEGPKATVSLLNNSCYTADTNLSEIFEYGNVKQYWGTSHVKQIDNFYSALLGKEKLYITAENAFLTQQMICDIYYEGKKHFSR